MKPRETSIILTLAACRCFFSLLHATSSKTESLQLPASRARFLCLIQIGNLFWPRSSVCHCLQDDLTTKTALLVALQSKNKPLPRKIRPNKQQTWVRSYPLKTQDILVLKRSIVFLILKLHCRRTSCIVHPLYSATPLVQNPKLVQNWIPLYCATPPLFFFFCQH